MNRFSEEFPDYYELLGVNPDADIHAIKRAYLEKIKQWHPDHNLAGSKEAEEKSKVLNQAYHILSDATRRRNYDRMRRFTAGKRFDDHINDAAMRRKFAKAYPAFKPVMDSVRELYALFKDAVKGGYRLDPTSLAAIGGGLLYFLLPIDLIPDFIPMAGFFDDLTILTTIMTSLKEEIAAYRSWKNSGGYESG